MSLYLYPYNEKSIYTEWRRATQHARSRGGWRLHLADFVDHLKVVHVVRVQDRCNTNTPGTKGHRKTQGQKAFLNANFPLVIPVIHKKSAAESMWTDVNRHCPVKDFFWFLPKVVGLIYLGGVAIYTKMGFWRMREIDEFQRYLSLTIPSGNQTWPADACCTFHHLWMTVPAIMSTSCRNFPQWIGLRENLQETIDFPIKYGAFL